MTIIAREFSAILLQSRGEFFISNLLCCIVAALFLLSFMPCIFYLSLLLICVTCVICVTWHCNVLRSINIIYINLYAQCHQYLGYHSGTHVILHLPISLLAQQNCMLLLYTFAYILGILSSSIPETCPLPTMSFGIGGGEQP